MKAYAYKLQIKTLYILILKKFIKQMTVTDYIFFSFFCFLDYPLIKFSADVIFFKRVNSNYSKVFYKHNFINYQRNNFDVINRFIAFQIDLGHLANISRGKKIPVLEIKYEFRNYCSLTTKKMYLSNSICKHLKYVN